MQGWKMTQSIVAKMEVLKIAHFLRFIFYHDVNTRQCVVRQIEGLYFGRGEQCDAARKSIAGETELKHFRQSSWDRS